MDNLVGIPEGAQTVRSMPPEYDTDVEKLCRLVTGLKPKQLLALRRRIEHPKEFTEYLSQVLPAALKQSTGNGPHLAASLEPLILDGVNLALVREPENVVKILAPIMGPAIRKSILNTIREFMESMDRILQQSMSLQGLKWRLEAMRTGRSFAEVVLYHTLEYRVEHVFLIHRETGILLQHVSAKEAHSEAPELVSGMLTAITDFVKDSFGTRDSDTARSLQVGEVTVYLENADDLYIAATVRGNPTHKVRHKLEEVLEAIRIRYHLVLENFSGDTAAFAGTQPLLEECLEVGYKPRTSAKRKVNWHRPAIALAICAMACIVWFGWHVIQTQRFQAFAQNLHRQPGILVTAKGRKNGKFFVEGLRDNLAESFAPMLEANKLKQDDLLFIWKPYLSLDPAITLKRFQKLLPVPDAVHATVVGDQLALHGHASLMWLRKVREKLPLLLGSYQLNVDNFITTEEKRLKDLQEKIASYRFYFDIGSLDFRVLTAAELKLIRKDILQATDLAQLLGKNLKMQLTGFSGGTGTEVLNKSLAANRQKKIGQFLNLDSYRSKISFNPVGLDSNDKVCEVGRTDCQISDPWVVIEIEKT